MEVFSAHDALRLSRRWVQQFAFSLYTTATGFFCSGASALLWFGNSKCNTFRFFHRRRLRAELLFLSRGGLVRGGGGGFLRAVVIVVHGSKVKGNETNKLTTVLSVREREQILTQYYLCVSYSHVLSL